jgi:NADH-quinone oxidoreductase subunit J
MNTAELLFGLFAVTACSGAIAVVFSQNIVRMAFWLVVSLGSVAGLFFMLDADFVAATQLMIYVGGTVVLLIFGVMLTASGPQMQLKTSPADGLLAAIVGSSFLLMIFFAISETDWSHAQASSAGYNKPEEGNTLRPIGLKLLGLSLEDLDSEAGSTPSSGYLLPFEIVSVHLLVVLIGAAYLARAKRASRSKPESIPDSE